MGQGLAALRDFNQAHVRFGSKADICSAQADVRYVPLATSCPQSSMFAFAAEGVHPIVQRYELQQRLQIVQPEVHERACRVATSSTVPLAMTTP